MAFGETWLEMNRGLLECASLICSLTSVLRADWRSHNFCSNVGVSGSDSGLSWQGKL